MEEKMLNHYNKFEEYRNLKISQGKIKKHIIIAGVPRSGKTTVSSMLVEKGSYQHLNMDAIVESLEKSFPNLGITTYTTHPETMVMEVSKKLTNFLNSIISANNYDKLDYKLVIDMLEITPHDYYYYIDKRFADIYFLGTPDLTPQEMFKNIRKNDTKEEYTFYLSDEELMKRCERFCDLSKYLEKECQKYDLPFINTSYQRNKKLKELVEKIMHQE